MTALIANVIALVLFTVAAAGVRAADIAVVMSSDAEVYQEALEGFREAARHRIVGVQNLKNSAAGGRDELIKLRATTKPDLVFAIGTPALQLVAREITDIPVVHAMVLNPATVSPAAGKNSTGITMNPAAEQVMSLIKELNPKFRRIGVIFDPSKSAHLVAPARQAAQKAGLQLVSKEIHSPGEIIGALNSLRNEIDLLYLLPDETIVADEILQRIFLFSFDNKIPVLGFSERHTQTGALLSLAHGSVKDMGRQAAQLANTLIADKKPALPAPLPPRETKLTVNVKTAHKLGIDIPDSIINRADNAIKAPVYREGDWWVFRIKILSHSAPPRIQDHRVLYKNGKFESRDPSFLDGGDSFVWPSIYPFPSVYLTDPQRKWLDFPLLPGKAWSYRFIRTYFGRGTSNAPGFSYGTASAEVIGQTSQLVKTAAGQFRAIEIQRRDSAVKSGAPLQLTYYYSPQTKSVIKSSVYDARYRHPVGYQFELELIAYGNDADGK
jgi:putative ABC transport system substrate-binding protein